MANKITETFERRLIGYTALFSFTPTEKIVAALQATEPMPSLKICAKPVNTK